MFTGRSLSLKFHVTEMPLALAHLGPKVSFILLTEVIPFRAKLTFKVRLVLDCKFLLLGKVVHHLGAHLLGGVVGGLPNDGL